MVAKSDVIRIPLGDTGSDAPGTLFDQRRTRTAWFEGQHVTADQFNRDQSYHLTRQSDLGRTIGQGVVEGLRVRGQEGSATALSITAGLGLAPSGEVIHLPQDTPIDLADIPTQRRLNALLDAPNAPSMPPETRTGLFVLAASTVEYASNPVGSYPVSATSTRTLQDSVINEALLFTLTPYPVPISTMSTADWQRSAAYRIFIESKDPELPAGALPLAMVALSGNRIVWIDMPMVRRACAPVSGDIFGLGLVDQTRRIAHFQQFDAMIDPVISAQSASAMPASALVDALPPMGRLPVPSIAMRGVAELPQRLSQNWLPASVPCELVAVPEDEIEALLRESVHLPPIDLTAGDKVLANTPVSILVPVPRAAWMSTPNEVIETALPLTPPPAVGGAPTSPADLLRELMDGTPAPQPSDSALTEEWRALLGQAQELWYARRRQFQRSDDTVTGVVKEDIPAPVEPVEPPGGGGTPTPQPSGIDPRVLIEMMAAPLAEQHERIDLMDDFRKFVELDPDILAPLMVRQEQALATGSDTLMGAITVGVSQGLRDPKEMMEAFDPSLFGLFLEVEPAILGAGMTFMLAPGPNVSIEKLQDVAQRFSPLGPTTVGRAIEGHAPLPLRSEEFLEPSRLQDVCGALIEIGHGVRLETLPRYDEQVIEARLNLMQAKELPRFLKINAEVKRSVWSDYLPALREVASRGVVSDDLMAGLIEQAESMV